MLAFVLKQNFNNILSKKTNDFEMTCNITASFFNTPQVKKDNGYMRVNRPRSIDGGDTA